MSISSRKSNSSSNNHEGGRKGINTDRFHIAGRRQKSRNLPRSLTVFVLLMGVLHYGFFISSVRDMASVGVALPAELAFLAVSPQTTGKDDMPKATALWPTTSASATTALSSRHLKQHVAIEFVPFAGSNHDLFAGDYGSFQNIMRTVHKERTSSKECRNESVKQATNRIQNLNRGGDENSDLSWYGSDLPHVSNYSCHFITKSFPPTKASIEHVINRPIYWSPFQTSMQCSAFTWNITEALIWDRADTYTTFGGLVGHKSLEECIEKSVGAVHARAFLNQTSALVTAWISENFNNDTMANAARVSIMESYNHCGLATDGGYGGGTFDYWNGQCLSKVLRSVQSIVVSQTNTSSNSHRALAASLRDSVLHLSHFPWKDGLQVTKTTLGQAYLPMIGRMGASIHGALPPSPYMVYVKDALATTAAHIPGEIYTPGGGSLWKDVADGNRRTHGPKLKKYASCKDGNATACPYPIYEKVITLSQGRCASYFHFYIEVWPRIGPWLKEIVEDDSIKLHLGCNKLGIQQQFFDLIGINASRIVNEDVFARELYIPTPGYGHTAYLNFWNLVAMRDYVERLYGRAGDLKLETGRNILVLVREEGGRIDSDRFSPQFFNDMSNFFPTDNIIKFGSSNSTLMECLLCQIKLFQEADVIISSHGAGQSHLMWAKRGATVMEVTHGGDKDNAIYGEMAPVFGFKYFPLSRQVGSKDVAEIINFATDSNNIMS